MTLGILACTCMDRGSFLWISESITNPEDVLGTGSLTLEERGSRNSLIHTS
jgi:hypothetical protein